MNHPTIDGRTWWVGPCPDTDLIDRDYALERSPEGLIYFARYVLGMVYFKDVDTGRVTFEIEWPDGKLRPAGLWPHGVFLKLAEDLVCEDMNVLSMYSRGCLKTSVVQADITQWMICNPDDSGLVHMESLAKAIQTTGVVKGHFDNNPVLRECFGDLRGNKASHEDGPTFKWSVNDFTLNTRERLSNRDPGLTPSGTDVNTTGGHYDRFWDDDPISWQKARSTDMVAKANSALEQMEPLFNQGCRQRHTMTPYCDGDVADTIVAEQGDNFRISIETCGMEAVSDYELTGEPVNPHQPKEFLLQKLKRMKARDFNLQYAMKRTNPADQIFKRTQFVASDWENRYSTSSCYILTDSAIKSEETGCMSALIAVILDWDDTALIADADVGYWAPATFHDRLLAFVERWHTLAVVKGVVMERITLNAAYRAYVDDTARRKGIPINFIEVPTGQSEDAKRLRIRGLSTRFEQGKVKVLSTMPRHWSYQGEERLLWDATGFKGEDGYEPSGEFVEQFVKFRNRDKGRTGAKMDIPDALAYIDAIDPSNYDRRYCTPTPRSRAIAQGVDMPSMQAGARVSRRPQFSPRRNGRPWLSTLSDRIR